ncbi:MAG TPA: HXXEE domain-containing protein [Gemmatimonadales bacterium]|nr:HXXEE domain-containing protein [Gemmatimonadales bacterium]
MPQFGWAWVALCMALAIHVADEAATDFLSVYNPAVRTIRARFPFLPLPTFTFPVWLGGLIAVTLLLFALSPAAFRGALGMRPAAYVFGVVMVGNGLLHLGGSVYMRKAMPGVYSAPLILAAAVNLLVAIP